MDDRPLFKKEMSLEELQASGRIIYSVVSGSHAYGTNTPESDVDLRGYYWVPPQDYVSLFDVQPQTDDPNHDTCYYTLKRAFDLLKTANPNQIELLWMPKDCIQIARFPIMDEMIANRKLFISKKTYQAHASYSAMQIKKAKGKNKKVHNPQPETMPKKEDFCWVILGEDGWEGVWGGNDSSKDRMPCRPVSIKEAGIDLSMYHVAALERVPNTYRLYLYDYEDDKPKGVFRGNDMLVCESISMEDEWERFKGLLIYNKQDYEKAVKEWHSYWDWVKNRNDARWLDQENGLVDFDAKNMMHCVRLLMSCEHIFTHGEPLVRMEGEALAYLKKIRSGEVPYEKIMEDVEARDERLKKLYETSTLIPQEVDMNALESLYKYLVALGMEMYQ